jgi:hypothetical protein
VALARYTLGLAALACVFASLGAGAIALRSWLLPQLRRAPARLADAVLCLALLIGILELLGTLGLFSFAPIVVGSTALGLGLRARLRPSTAGKRGRSQRRRCWRASDALGLGVPLLAAGLVLAEWAQLSVQSYQKGILGFDSIWYHLPLAGSFAQTGQITGIRFTNVEYLTGFYPATLGRRGRRRGRLLVRPQLDRGREPCSVVQLRIPADPASAAPAADQLLCR